MKRFLNYVQKRDRGRDMVAVEPTEEVRSTDAHDIQVALSSRLSMNTIFDIGANIGQTTAIYSGLFPQATIYSFEPFPSAFKQLSDTFSKNDRVNPVQVAISNTKGTKKFYVNHSSYTNSFFPSSKEVHRWVEPREQIEHVDTIEVPTTTIDDFCRQKSIKTIDILKMDIQGGELLALEGASQQLEQGAIALIYTEVMLVPIYEGQAFFNEIYNFLARYGFALFDIYNREYNANGQVKWADAIFASPHISKSL